VTSAAGHQPSHRLTISCANNGILPGAGRDGRDAHVPTIEDIEAWCAEVRRHGIPGDHPVPVYDGWGLRAELDQPPERSSMSSDTFTCQVQMPGTNHICGSRDLVINARDNLWYVACGEGHQQCAVPGAVITVTGPKITYPGAAPSGA
jgi:hypothetical protein